MKNHPIIPAMKINFSIKDPFKPGLRLDSEESITPGSGIRKYSGYLNLHRINSQKRSTKSTKDSLILNSPYTNHLHSVQFRTPSPRKAYQRPATALKASLNFIKKSRIERIERIQKNNLSSNHLSYWIKKARSDKLEIIRDVATYECEFSENRNLFQKLNEIELNCFAIKNAFEFYLALNQNNLDINSFFNENLQSLKSIEHEHLNKDKSQGIEMKGNYSLSRIEKKNKAYRIIFTGVKMISCFLCFLRIEANDTDCFILISLSTLFGECLNFYLDSNPHELYKLTLSKNIDYLISKLWILFDHSSITLCCDENCNKTFISIIIKLKGYQHTYKTVILEQENEDVTFSIPHTLLRVQINVKEMTDKISIFQENPKRLKQLLESRLVFIPQKNSYF